MNEAEKYVEVIVPLDNIYLIDKQDITACEVKFDDGRSISVEQRKKIYATINDISAWCGHLPEPLKEYLKYLYMSNVGCEYFSLSNCDMTTARHFLSYLIEFCFYWGVSTRDTLLNRTDDIGKYLYQCLLHRKCAVCNDKADIHHIDRIGMGNDRQKVNHIGREAIALCRKHHNEAHMNEKEFLEKHHIYGIKLDEYLVKKLKL